MVCRVDEVGLGFRDELSIRSYELGLIHWPLLNGLLLFAAMVIAIGRTPVWVEVVSIGMKIVPGGKRSSLSKLSFVEGSMGAIGPMGHSQWMLIELGHRHHLFELSMVREMVLSIGSVLLHE